MDLQPGTQATGKIKAMPIPDSPAGRISYGVVVTVLPMICFSFIRLFEPDWQSGRLSDYVALFLSPEASWVFFPLIAFSSIALICLLANPERYPGIFVIRLGVYTGAVLALQYTLLVLALFPELDVLKVLIPIWVSPLVAIPAYRFLVKRLRSRTVNAILIGLVALLYLWAVVPSLDLRGWGALLDPPYFLAGIAAAGAPFWSLLIMGALAVHLLQYYETGLTLRRGLGLLAWLSGFVLVWRIAVLRTLELYADLPTSPPDCYVATAAARGHPRFVGSRAVRLENGRCLRVNAQLQHLKSAELALLAVAPRLHARLRRIYDAVGGMLARLLAHPLPADAAYLLLKPFEWIAMFMLGMIVPEINSISRKLYIK